MKKKVIAALLALLLFGGKACPSVLADGPPMTSVTGPPMTSVLRPAMFSATGAAALLATSPLVSSGTGLSVSPVAMLTGPAITIPTEPAITIPTGPSAAIPTGPAVTGPTGPAATGPAELPQLPGDSAEKLPEDSSNQLLPEDSVDLAGARCDTIEELEELVRGGAGGRISITGDLTLGEGAVVWLIAEKPVTIDLGRYGITIPKGASLNLSGPVTVTGNGAPRPLLTASGFLSADEGAVISAFGENAVAVRIIGGGFRTNRAVLEVSGANACAVESDSRLELFRARMSARGENARCIRADGPVWLILCKAESEGDLAAASSLILDGTVAAPEPEGARIVRRVAVPHDQLASYGLWIEAGASREELNQLLEANLFSNQFEYGLSDEAQKAEDILYFTKMKWTGENVDLNMPGRYWFTGTPDDWDLGAVEPIQKKVFVYVADPAKPAIEAAYHRAGSVSIDFFRPIEGADQVTLWYSLDKGKSWNDTAELSGTVLTASGAFLSSLPEPNQEYLFRLVVEGGPMEGVSNTLQCLCYDNLWGGGGDWDGSDWGDQGELPDDNVAPRPDQGSGSSRPKPSVPEEPDQEVPEQEKPEQEEGAPGQGEDVPGVDGGAVIPAPGSGSELQETGGSSVKSVPVSRSESQERGLAAQAALPALSQGGKAETAASLDDSAAATVSQDGNGAATQEDTLAAAGGASSTPPGSDVSPGGTDRMDLVWLFAAGGGALAVLAGFWLYRRRGGRG